MQIAVLELTNFGLFETTRHEWFTCKLTGQHVPLYEQLPKTRKHNNNGLSHFISNFTHVCGV